MATLQPHRRSVCAQWVALCLCFSLLHASAWAASPETERAEAKVIEAKAFFKSALYQEAATSYLQAYAISKKPATLFNAARAYEEAKLYAKAIALFEQYVQLADTPADGRREANERIAHNHAELVGHLETTTTVPTRPVEVTPPHPTEHAVTKATEAEEAEKAPETKVTAQPEGRKSNWLDWALFAGGDTLVIVGLLGYSGAVNSVNQANAMDFSALDAESTYKKQVAAARSTRTGSAILAVVGAGVAGWGAWRLWGPKAAAPDAPAKSSSWLLPTVAPDAAGLAWGGRF